MTKRMLIDSTNAEETRVVVLDGNRLDEFDLETSTKHQLKGNIYLAKVVRVEPSLQAAFVEYGGNRHGFLAFGEIHPDYYQIPVADRKRLLEAQEQEAIEDEEAEDRAAAAQDRRGDDAGATSAAAEPTADPATLTAASNDHPTEVMSDATDLASPIPTSASDTSDRDSETDRSVGDTAANDEAGIDPVPPAERVEMAQPMEMAADIVVAPEEAAALFPDSDDSDAAPPLPSALSVADAETDDAEPDGPAPEQLGGENDTEDQARRATPRFLRHYKIQEVIRRRQILLIQVVKEERGSKGAALTTYISLAGRFSVLMPNSPRGGGISRKITSASDRRRLKEVTAELDLPRGMGLIVRTAGANRPKPEILRDCEYLLNQWDQIRELTMKSMAPALIYEEASLIKRAIRDVYSRDVDDILVDGEAGWRAARDFMRMLMPTHARKVQLWKEPQPLFAKAQVEQQLEQMLQPTVQLRSGGYLVINQTEALVAIDVNSGRSTRERGIEETALRTNLEAAEEAARQLRLRDLAGLIVIDFIDMESRRNVAAVERKLKDALKHDRARIQVGGISHFGLLEMSRQRLRPSLTETNFVVCAHCGGTGHVRSTESAALVALRAIEDEGGRRRAAEIQVTINGATAIYILNHKRQRLTEIEARYGMLVSFVADETLMPPQLKIEKIRAQTASDAPPPIQQLAPPEPFEDPDEIEPEMDADETEDAEDEAGTAVVAEGDTAENGDRRGRRRRRRRGGRREDGRDEGAAAGAGADHSEADESEADGETGPAADDRAPDVDAVSGEAEVSADGAEETVADGSGTEGADAEEGERRRRGRRGGRRRRRDGSEAAPTAASTAEEPDSEPAAPVANVYVGPTPADPFAGASAFDIFDAIEQAEEQRLTQPRTVAAASALDMDRDLVREPAPEADDADEAPAAIGEPEPAIDMTMPAADPVPPADVPSRASELMAETAPVAEAAAQPEPAAMAPEPEPQPAPLPQPEPVAAAAEPVAGPAVQPIVIGDAAPGEKKRGWWRR